MTQYQLITKGMFLAKHPSLKNAFEAHEYNVPMAFPDGSLDDENWVFISEVYETQIDKEEVERDYIKKEEVERDYIKKEEIDKNNQKL